MNSNRCQFLTPAFTLIYSIPGHVSLQFQTIRRIGHLYRDHCDHSMCQDLYAISIFNEQQRVPIFDPSIYTYILYPGVMFVCNFKQLENWPSLLWPLRPFNVSRSYKPFLYLTNSNGCQFWPRHLHSYTLSRGHVHLQFQTFRRTDHPIVTIATIQCVKII